MFSLACFSFGQTNFEKALDLGEGGGDDGGVDGGADIGDGGVDIGDGE